MTTETNRFAPRTKCERCGFPYGWHVCLAPEILALDKGVPSTSPAPNVTPRKQPVRRKPGRTTYTMGDKQREACRAAARERSAANREKNRARDEKIVEDYSENFMSMNEVAAKFLISKDTVKAILVDFGAEIRPRGWTRASQILRDNIETAVKEYESGMTRDALAAKWSVSNSTMSLELVKAGVKMRPRPGHQTKYTFN